MKITGAGFDVAFLAPKSVSILMEAFEVNGQEHETKNIRLAYEKATQFTMKELEDEILGVKNKKEKKQESEECYNMTTIRGLIFLILLGTK